MGIVPITNTCVYVCGQHFYQIGPANPSRGQLWGVTVRGRIDRSFRQRFACEQWMTRTGIPRCDVYDLFFHESSGEVVALLLLKVFTHDTIQYLYTVKDQEIFTQMFHLENYPASRILDCAPDAGRF